MSGPVETEFPSDFRREKLRLTLHRSISEPEDLKDRVKSITADELARKIRTSNTRTGGQNRQPYLLLDCRGYLCYSESHILGSVHIACTDRFNRKRVQNSGSVLDLVSTNNIRRGGGGNKASHHGKWRDVIIYDDGTTDLTVDAGWQTPISFVLMHLLQENRQPIFLKGGFKEFTRYYKDLCDTCNRKDLHSPMPTSTTPLLFPGPLSVLPPLSPSATMSTPNCVDRYENEPPSEVLPFLYVGNARDSSNPNLLKELGIRYILSVTTHTPHPHSSGGNSPTTSTVNEPKCDVTTTTAPPPPPSPSSNVLATEFRTKWIPVSDNLSENLAPYFEDACSFIEEARQKGEKILIHCHAGISRSPTIAIAYIMKHINLSTLEAYAFVQRNRRIISPNLNFMGQLVEFESKLKGTGHSETESSTESCSSLDSSGSHDSLSVSPMIIAD
ncbi:dual specificity protein phosphatase 10 [Folsomia candida]|nr:dual specificity protein phosphatase 10 [Folsomia candida]